MWHRYWQNLLWIKQSLLLFLFPLSLFAQAHLVENFDELLELDKTILEKKSLSINEGLFDIRILENAKSIEIDRDYLQSLLLNSERRFLDLIKLNSCNFYTLLQLNLLKSNLGDTTRMLVNIKSDTKEKKLFINKDKYLDFIFKKKCFKLKDYYQLFSLEKLRGTFSKIPLPIPKTRNQCQQILTNWQGNLYLPYICAIDEKINDAKEAQTNLSNKNFRDEKEKVLLARKVEEGRKFNAQISGFQRSYIGNLCKETQESGTFCPRYLSNNYWTKVLNNQGKISHLKYRCQKLLNKNVLKERDYNICRQQIESSPTICHDLTLSKYPSLTPAPSCSALEKTLPYTRKKTSFMDCPTEVDNHGVTFVSRIIDHFEPVADKYPSKYCSGRSSYLFSKLVADYKLTQAWDVNLCYNSRLLKEKKCYPTLLNSYPDSPISEEKVVTKILKDITPFPKNGTCQVTPSSEFNPIMLKYKTGCHLVFDPSSCSATSCPKNIVVNGKPFTEIKYEANVQFSLFATSFRDTQKNMIFLLKDRLKLKDILLDNLTLIKAFLKNHKNGLIAGEGCRESLLPEYNRSFAFNKCTPTSFVIESIEKESTPPRLIVSLSIEDNQTNRSIAWENIFDSLSSYRAIHPRNTWMLYGLYR